METVRCYRRRALRRPPSQSWRTFLANHRPQLRAADFFTVQTLTLQDAVRLLLHHARAPPHRAFQRDGTGGSAVGVASVAGGDAVGAAAPLSDPGPRPLVRRCLHGKARAIGIKTVLTAVRAPQANASAERVVGTLRRECLDHLMIVNERHLRLVLREYVAHYNHVRPHQALELWAPDDRRPRSPPRSEGQVVGRPILGGLHHEYERLAA